MKEYDFCSIAPHLLVTLTGTWLVIINAFSLDNLVPFTEEIRIKYHPYTIDD